MKYYNFRLLEDGTYSIAMNDRFREKYGKAADCPEEITVPSSFRGLPVTVIGERGFEEVKAKKIILPDSIKIIETRAFYYCSDLEEINIPDGITSVGESVFYSDRLKYTVKDQCRYLGNQNNPYVLLCAAENDFDLSSIFFHICGVVRGLSYM